MSEILTLDSKGNIKTNDILQFKTNDSNPQFTIGRIYRLDNCAGTGFIVNSCRYGPLFLSCKHLATDMFISKELPCWVCFDLNQQHYSLYQSFITKDENDHICGRFFKLKLLGLASSIHDPICSELDSITNFPYNLPFDAALFFIKNKCTCNRFCKFPQFIPSKLTIPPSINEHIDIIGFMGRITMYTAPLTDVTNADLETMNNSLKEGNLAISRGNVISQGDVFCVSNPTTSGFSGSPVLREIDGNLITWGLFLGGPALIDHSFLVTLSNQIKNDENEAMNMLNHIDAEQYYCVNYFKKLLKSNLSVYCVKEVYEKMINVARRKNRYDKAILNHNLCLPLSRIAGFLEYYGVSIE